MAKVEAECGPDVERWSAPQPPKTSANGPSAASGTAPRETLDRAPGGALGRAMRIAASSRNDCLPEGLAYALQTRLNHAASSSHSEPKQPASSAPSERRHSASTSHPRRPPARSSAPSSAPVRALSNASTSSRQLPPPQQHGERSSSGLRNDRSPCPTRSAAEPKQKYTPPMAPRIALREVSARKRREAARREAHERRRANLQSLRSKLSQHAGSRTSANHISNSVVKPRSTLLSSQLGRQVDQLPDHYGLHSKPKARPFSASRRREDNGKRRRELGNSPEEQRRWIEIHAKKLVQEHRNAEREKKARSMRALRIAKQQAQQDQLKLQRKRSTRRQRDEEYNHSGSQRAQWIQPPARRNVMQEEATEEDKCREPGSSQLNQNRPTTKPYVEKEYSEESLHEQMKRTFDRLQRLRAERARQSDEAKHRALNAAKKEAARGKSLAKKYKRKHPEGPSAPKEPWIDVLTENNEEALASTSVPYTPEDAILLRESEGQPVMKVKAASASMRAQSASRKRPSNAKGVASMEPEDSVFPATHEDAVSAVNSKQKKTQMTYDTRDRAASRAAIGANKAKREPKIDGRGAQPQSRERAKMTLMQQHSRQASSGHRRRKKGKEKQKRASELKGGSAPLGKSTEHRKRSKKKNSRRNLKASKEIIQREGKNSSSTMVEAPAEDLVNQLLRARVECNFQFKGNNNAVMI